MARLVLVQPITNINQFYYLKPSQQENPGFCCAAVALAVETEIIARVKEQCL